MPFLEYLPSFLKPWVKQGRAGFERDINWARSRMANQEYPDSFLSRVVAADKGKGLASDDGAPFLSFNLIQGAADTSQMSTWIFLEAMMCFPDVQEEAQQEIDKVVGDRLPRWEDVESIPYVRCLMKETWRWRPPVGLGHPHVTTRDLEYNGMRIPKGARIHPNAWAIQRDPARHVQPDQFWPERFLGDDTTTQQSINSPDPTKSDHFAFGAGRRVCPGMHLAERSLAIAIMRILWAFNIKPAAGAKLPASAETYPGAIPGVASPDLPVSMVVRSEEKLKITDHLFAKRQQPET